MVAVWRQRGSWQRSAIVTALLASLAGTPLADEPAADNPYLAEPGLSSRIGAVARLGWEALAAGHADDLATLEPIYVHGVPRATRPVRDPNPRM